MYNFFPDRIPEPGTPSRQRGFGLLQVMLVLMLAAVAVAAASLLLNAKRPADQASNQQQYLRWADEGLIAYAAANGRLPCPATSWNEDPSSVLENCVADGSAGSPQAVGYLPIAALPGAPEMGAGAGPIRYSVSRGVIAADSTGSQNRQPALSDTGDAYIPSNEQGEQFDDYADPSEGVGNGLDFCAALGQNAISGATSDAYATTTDARGNSYNVAYGLVAAGITGNANTRFDSASSVALPSPAKASDVDYDDRARVRTFAELAPLVGCRQYAATGIAEAPSSVALLSMDVLAGAVANHATVVGFQETNEGNGEAQVRDATFAQVMAITSIVLSSLTLVDSIQSAVFHGVTLGIDTAICIASLGTVCAPLAKDIIANILSVGAMIQSISALVQNTVALAPIGIALDANVKARDRAKNSLKPATSSVEDVLKSMEKMLYGATEESCKTKTDPKTGLPIQRRDSNGNPIYNDKGVPEFECVIANEFQPGLKQDVESSKNNERNMIAAEQVYYLNRIRPFEDAGLASLMNLSASASKYKITTCEYTGTGPNKYDGGNCTPVLPPEFGGFDRVTRFKPNALEDAKLRRNYAQRWAVLQREVDDTLSTIKEKEASQKQWSSLVDGAHKDAEKICSEANNAESIQICTNSRQQVQYMKTCTYTIIKADGSTGLFSELNPGAGQAINYDAQCTPMINLDLQRTKNVLTDKEAQRNTVKRSYDNQTSPYMVYPANWNHRRVIIDTDIPSFTWDTANVWRYNDLPSDGSNGLHLMASPNIMDSDQCSSLKLLVATGSECSRYPYSRAYADWLQAKEGADKAIENRTQIEARFNELEAKYKTLKNAAAPGSGIEALLAVGAPALLLKADSRGAVGPARPKAATP